MSTIANHSARTWLLQELESVFDDAMHGVCAAMLAMRPYAELAEQHGEGVLRESVQGLLRTMLRCLGERRSVDQVELDHLTDLGAQRLRQGVDLELVDRVFFLVFEQCCQDLTRLARRSADPFALDALADMLNELAPLSRTVWRAVDRGYRGADRRCPDLGGDVVADALVALLAGRADRRQMARLGWSPGERRALVIVVPERDGRESAVRAALQAVSSVLPGCVVAPARRPSPHGVAVAPWPRCSLALESALRELADRLGLRLLLGDPGTAEGLAVAYGWLRQELEVVRTVEPGTRLLPLERLARVAVVARCPVELAMWQLRRALGPVLAQQPHLALPLLETLEALRDAGVDVRAAAERMCLSEPGLRNRLERIQRLTGLSYRVAGDAWLLLHAVDLWRHHGESLPPVGDPAWT